MAGPSGSGKSTISYAVNGMIPYRIKGFSKGNVNIFGKDIWKYDFMTLSKSVGLVKQNPLEQLVTFTVRDEIAFGLENLKYPEHEIKERVSQISEFMGIKEILDRNIDQLSGGQKQLTILSSFLVMNPKILILDEPIAFLDQDSESLLLNRLHKLIKSKDYQLTLIIIEHRLSRILDIANRIVVLDNDGKIALKGKIDNIMKKKFYELKSLNVRVPWLLNVFDGLKHTDQRPYDFQKAIDSLNNFSKPQLYELKKSLLDKEIKPIHLNKYEDYENIISFDNLYIESIKNELEDKKKKKFIEKPQNTIIEIKNLKFNYPNSNIQAIRNLSFTIQSGDFIGLVGPNGSGKTTLLYLLAGLYQPTSGKIIFKGQNLEELDQDEYLKNIGFIFQNPESMIFKRTIKDEILYAPKNFNILDKVDDQYLEKLISLVGNEDPEKNPFNLSWGQKRRLNLSSVFVYKPDIILLDEPFIGQDQKTIEELIETLFIENKRGKTIIISSHDYHLLLKYTRKIIELNKDGSLKDYDLNGRFFQKHSNLGPILLMNRINELLIK
ncbi:MAG: ATP-binding cassette domain-containing protein [Candidatus Lokiarchaeota archaeon]|nr:ATP-binding cassette domain-containing protein [Candidatus Lokiarchaeota archaeon]MBD3200218.1 ATP-binding cassette domain-containing protein [Candidatus Lokiarchaeota archaeon]